MFLRLAAHFNYYFRQDSVSTFFLGVVDFSRPDNLSSFSLAVQDNLRLGNISRPTPHRVIMYFIETKATSRLPYFGNLPMNTYLSVVYTAAVATE
jgi:hypothetical protein